MICFVHCIPTLIRSVDKSRWLFHVCKIALLVQSLFKPIIASVLSSHSNCYRILWSFKSCPTSKYECHCLRDSESFSLDCPSWHDVKTTSELETSLRTCSNLTWWPSWRFLSSTNSSYLVCLRSWPSRLSISAYKRVLPHHMHSVNKLSTKFQCSPHQSLIFTMPSKEDSCSNARSMHAELELDWAPVSWLLESIAAPVQKQDFWRCDWHNIEFLEI